MDQSANKEQDEISLLVVLGLKLKEVSKDTFEMKNFLIDRLELANKLFQSILYDEKQQFGCNQSKSCIILSGRGKNGNESVMMRDYLKRVYKYLDQNLFAEENSMTTVENFVFSLFQIWKRYERVYTGKKLNLLIITSDYHKDRSQYILDKFLPLVKKGFVKNTIQNVKFYGSLTHTTEEQYLYDLSQQQIDEFLDPNYDWSQFADFRYLHKDDHQLFIEYSKYYKNQI